MKATTLNKCANTQLWQVFLSSFCRCVSRL